MKQRVLALSNFLLPETDLLSKVTTPILKSVGAIMDKAFS